jgi:hypothetical protein
MTDLPSNHKIPPETPQNPLLNYLVEYFTSHPDKLKLITCFLVNYALPDLTASLILDFKKKGLSFSEISLMFGYSAGKSMVHRMSIKTYFPYIQKNPIYPNYDFFPFEIIQFLLIPIS